MLSVIHAISNLNVITVSGSNYVDEETRFREINKLAHGPTRNSTGPEFVPETG